MLIIYRLFGIYYKMTINSIQFGSTVSGYSQQGRTTQAFQANKETSPLQVNKLRFCAEKSSPRVRAQELEEKIKDNFNILLAKRDQEARLNNTELLSNHKKSQTDFFNTKIVPATITEDKWMDIMLRTITAIYIPARSEEVLGLYAQHASHYNELGEQIFHIFESLNYSSDLAFNKSLTNAFHNGTLGELLKSEGQLDSINTNAKNDNEYNNSILEALQATLQNKTSRITQMSKTLDKEWNDLHSLIDNPKALIAGQQPKSLMDSLFAGIEDGISEVLRKEGIQEQINSESFNYQSNNPQIQYLKEILEGNIDKFTQMFQEQQETLHNLHRSIPIGDLPDHLSD